ncbi:MAG: superoxide dismutase, Ni [DPANN group archaeon]|nr:superoxide dismutase, Ni [DPANN group archaeon]
MLHKLLQLLDKIKPARTAWAHCDIPCGIYDPHLAQMAVNTVIRMDALIAEVKQVLPTDADTRNKMIRYVVVKEQHAEIVKHELRILWADYFKPEHLQKFPGLHDLFWNAMKTASKAKQSANPADAEALLEAVNKIAEIFWKTKDVKAARVKAPYPTGKDVVWPKI